MRKSDRNRILLIVVLLSMAVLLYCVGRMTIYTLESFESESGTQSLRDQIGVSTLKLAFDELTGMVITERTDGKAKEADHQYEYRDTEQYADTAGEGAGIEPQSGAEDQSASTSTGEQGGVSSSGQSAAQSAPRHREVLDKYSYIYGKNQDLIGWISIEGTNIDYPVMQRPGDENYYLKNDFFHESDASGVPFLDDRCDVSLPSSNLLIYGHNMKNGTKFADLLKYEEKSYYQNHRYIRFDTIYEEGLYEVIAVFRSRVAYVDEDTFRFYNFINAPDSASFEEFVRNIKALSLYDIPATAICTDRLITLTTCEYSVADGRFVVVARAIR